MAKLIVKGDRTKFSQRLDWLSTVISVNIAFVVLCFIGALVCNLVPKIRDSQASNIVNSVITVILSIVLVLYVIFALLLILVTRKVQFNEFNAKELNLRLIVCSSLILAFGVVSIGMMGSLAATKTTNQALGIATAVMCVCWIIMICIVSWFVRRCRTRITNFINVARVTEHE